MPEDLSEDIARSAREPQSASADGQSVTNPDLSKQIEADKYLASKQAAASGFGWANCLRAHGVPPGATGQ